VADEEKDVETTKGSASGAGGQTAGDVSDGPESAESQGAEEPEAESPQEAGATEGAEEPKAESEQGAGGPEGAEEPEAESQQDEGGAEGGSLAKRTAIGAAVGAVVGGAAAVGRDALSEGGAGGAKERVRESGKKVKDAASKVGEKAKQKVPRRHEAEMSEETEPGNEQ
jgi:hypothetical protein